MVNWNNKSRESSAVTVVLVLMLWGLSGQYNKNSISFFFHLLNSRSDDQTSTSWCQISQTAVWEALNWSTIFLEKEIFW